eukprot:1187884-Prorocentrum_minimum.AAC.4
MMVRALLRVFCVLFCGSCLLFCGSSVLYCGCSVCSFVANSRKRARGTDAQVPVPPPSRAPRKPRDAGAAAAADDSAEDQEEPPRDDPDRPPEEPQPHRPIQWFESFASVPPEMTKAEQRGGVRMYGTMFPPPKESPIAEQLPLCVRVLPQHLDSSGFFVALFEKTKPLPAAADLPELLPDVFVVAEKRPSPPPAGAEGATAGAAAEERTVPAGTPGVTAGPAVFADSDSNSDGETSGDVAETAPAGAGAGEGAGTSAAETGSASPANFTHRAAAGMVRTASGLSGKEGAEGAGAERVAEPSSSGELATSFAAYLTDLALKASDLLSPSKAEAPRPPAPTTVDDGDRAMVLCQRCAPAPVRSAPFERSSTVPSKFERRTR